MSLQGLEREIVDCEACPRLRAHCEKIAAEKKRQFQNEIYWGRPIPGFGDPRAELLIVGLAPAAHGANRTGRMFTGDQSGLWLYRALYRAHFSNQEVSSGRSDGLRLENCYITAIARCAPPGNKPTPVEIENCSGYLRTELKELKNLRAYLVLGQIALAGLWKVLPPEVKPFKGVPKFSHGAQIQLKDGRMVLCSYHPSQQNTFTKKLTEPMFDEIFGFLGEFLKKN